ncbi:multidrug effflux MFS transporter [Thauera sp. SWB20]|uniref:multidrug effflux MFS transporter n=1 Tax=Thauera sp. SWB20 TaxID=1572758 RepID=UPI0005ADB9A4|nr:multidrug effflux MFS transporter [Thauera sp. SWB20]KIN92366.1 drug resistance transporter, Bcr/CflA subfamily protein [Thauera sp. SWB20]
MPAPLVILILSLLLGLQPITTDLYLPALPALTASFGAVPAQAQLTLTALLLAFGASQLFWGPLSDRIGRRRVLLIGLAGYTLAAVGSALAGSIEVMVFWRVLQGAFMGAGTVCARAIVRDLYAPQEGARAMSKGLSGLGVAACLSPPLGGVLAEWFGWRATLAALTVMGAATLFVVARHFQETLHERHPEALQPAVLLRTARGIVGNRSFWTYASLCTASFGGLFCILSASSFVFINLLGTSPSFYGVLLLLSAFYIGGTMLCRRMIQRFGVQRSVMIGGALSLSGGGLMLAFALSGVSTVWTIMVPAFIFMLGHGVHQPCGQSGAIAPFPKAAGAASAITGILMMVVAFGAAYWVGANMDGSALPMIVGVAFCSAAVAFIAWVPVQRVRLGAV